MGLVRFQKSGHLTLVSKEEWLPRWTNKGKKDFVANVRKNWNS